LAGCIISIPTPGTSRGLENIPADDTGPWTNRKPTEMERVLARSDFSVDLIRFSDMRRPRTMETPTPDQLIQFYEPDTLLRGVTVQVPAMLEKYMVYRPRMTKNYAVEVELKKLNTNILTGTFWSGSWGRYAVDVEVGVLARRPDSRVVVSKTYRLTHTMTRKSYNGYAPSAERDRAMLYDLTEDTLRDVASQIQWDIRQTDARFWNLRTDEKAREKAALESLAAPAPVVNAKPSDVLLPVPAAPRPDVPNTIPAGAMDETMPVSTTTFPPEPVMDPDRMSI
jgi:hypothetical protein